MALEGKVSGCGCGWERTWECVWRDGGGQERSQWQMVLALIKRIWRWMLKGRATTPQWRLIKTGILWLCADDFLLWSASVFDVFSFWGLGKKSRGDGLSIQLLTDATAPLTAECDGVGMVFALSLFAQEGVLKFFIASRVVKIDPQHWIVRRTPPISRYDHPILLLQFVNAVSDRHDQGNFFSSSRIY